MAEQEPWYQEFGAEFWMVLSASIFAFLVKKSPHIPNKRVWWLAPSNNGRTS